MQTLAAPLSSAAHGSPAAAASQGVVAQLQRSAIYREYQSAFEATTGLPMALRRAGSFQSPLHGSRRANPFCALMAGANKSCAACLQLQQRAETEAVAGPRTLECFAGLSESSIPIRNGEQVIGFLQTGQVFLRRPTPARFARMLRQLAEWGVEVDRARIEAAYFRTRVLAKAQYGAVVRLLGIFGQQLAAMSNQVMVSEAHAELPVIARARAFIAAQHTEELSLASVARAANMSAFHFCKVFKRVTGLTFTAYLARVRVETVKRLLLKPHARMSEAAYAAGFQSLSQFNRVFHRVAGESPSCYHERLHGKARGATVMVALALPHAA